MSHHDNASGSCICGKSRFTVKNMSSDVGACHCNTCRKWGGGPLLAVDCGSEVAFDEGSEVSVYNSSDWAERGFCTQCGSHLYYRLKQTQQYIMPVGLIDNIDDFNFDHQIFIDEKPSFYCFSNKTEDMTGAEVFAKFAPPEA